MKIAIVHDVYIEEGGAERVLVALLHLFPSADVFIPFITKEKTRYIHTLTSGAFHSSWLNDVPFIHKASLFLKPFLYGYWEHLDFSRYDLVISSSHSFSSKSILVHMPTIHVSYIHTPPRYLYAEYNETQILRNPTLRSFLSPLLVWLRKKDFVGAQGPNLLIANSKTVQRRIKKYYRRDSIVVYPPVKIPRTMKITSNKSYFLCVSRFAKQKGIGLAIRACNTMKEDLVIVGVGSEERALRKMAGPTIHFLGHVPDKQMGLVYSSAKALIYPSIEEDFGMVPVEAMAHGVPVIGFASGGVLETVVDNKTGILFAEHTTRALVEAMKKFQSGKIMPDQCFARAKKFSEKRFYSTIKGILEKKKKQRPRGNPLFQH